MSIVAVFHPGRMLTTMEYVVAERGGGDAYNLEQEVVDRSGARKVFGCVTSGDHDDVQRETEDDCLLRCLLDKFVRKFGCVHPRCAGQHFSCF